MSIAHPGVTSQRLLLSHVFVHGINFFFPSLMALLCIFFFSDRIPEAALLARSYLPSKVSEIVALWKNDLHKVAFNFCFSCWTSVHGLHDPN